MYYCSQYKSLVHAGCFDEHLTLSERILMYGAQ